VGGGVGQTRLVSVWESVVGQPGVVAQLQAAAAAPVHAYLLVGPPGAGGRAAAEAFSAALLCADHGCGECRDCRLVLGGDHPDVVTHLPTGASLRRDEAEEIVRLAVRSPIEGRRKVLVLHEMHKVSVVAPMLLKTIEEPPESTVFVVLADFVPPELVTIASRCVTIEVPPLGRVALERVLVDEGVAPDTAAAVAAASGGSIDRARLLVSDAGLAARREQWAMVPRRLDGSGAVVSVVVDELRQLIEDAAAPLVAQHEAELAELEERVAQYGERGSGRRQLEEAHKRALRRHRSEELRFGLATLADRSGGPRGAPDGDARALMGAVQAIDGAAEALLRNPNEALLLQGLLLRLPQLVS
jgi:DNA polymerase-3 subunit delta'